MYTTNNYDKTMLMQCQAQVHPQLQLGCVDKIISCFPIFFSHHPLPACKMIQGFLSERPCSSKPSTPLPYLSVSIFVARGKN